MCCTCLCRARGIGVAATHMVVTCLSGGAVHLYDGGKRYVFSVTSVEAAVDAGRTPDVYDQPFGIPAALSRWLMDMAASSESGIKSHRRVQRLEV